MRKKREKSQLEKVFDGHEKWLKTVMNLGATKEDAEDIVGDMYVNIGQMLQKGLDISYNDEINYYYVYLALKSRFVNMVKKKSKMSSIPIEEYNDVMGSEYVDFDSAEDIVEEELDKMLLSKKDWYSAKVYNLIQGGYSLRELSNKTGIKYHSLYHTYRNTKEHLKTKLQ
tara:strand:+ start:236 stop:745 length:510 start_codon:yes stop_codon:yes gene_type:complete